VTEIGPPHARIFTSEVSVDGVVRGQGTGTTIKMSEQAAAGQALASLAANGTAG
jgi:ribonuclease-3